MKHICKAEVFKLFHRTETYIIIALMFLSFGLPIGFKFAPSSYSLDYAFGDGRLPCTAYMVMGYAFWGTLGIFILLISMLSVALSSKEIETHYYYLYFPRVKNRGEIYAVKHFILTVFVVVWYLMYTLLLNPIGHKMMCIFRPDMAVGILSDESSTYWVCIWIINFAELLFYISLVTALGTKLKPLTTISAVMVLYYASIFIHDYPVIRYLIPEYYKQSAVKCVNMDDISQLLLYTISCTVMLLTYDVLLFFWGKKQFKQINA